MGEVYLGEDKQLQRKSGCQNHSGIYRPNENARDFRREALILSKLNHENIKIYNIIEIDDIDFWFWICWRHHAG